MLESSEFSYDEKKRLHTIDRRGLDLLDMHQLFDGRPQYTYASPRNNEQRFTTVAELHGKLCAVAWKFGKAGCIHLITAHRAQIRQEREFHRLGLARQVNPDLGWWKGRVQQPLLPVREAEHDQGKGREYDVERTSKHRDSHET